MALHERQRSGLGQVIDVSLTDSIFAMLEGILPEYGQFGIVRERTGGIAHNSAPTNAYPCADGEQVCIAANTTRLVQRLMAVIERPDLAADSSLRSNEGRVRRAAELDAAISDWTINRSADEVIKVMRQHLVPVSRIASIADAARDPQLVAREMIVSVADDRLDKPLLVPGITPKLSRTPGHVPGLARPLGADTEEVERRLGAISLSPGKSPAVRTG
jgi:formyl-CoA transferase